MGLTPIVIVGAGGFGREVAWLIEEINRDTPKYELLGFLDDGVDVTVEGYPTLGAVSDWLDKPNLEIEAILAVGDPLARYILAHKFNQIGTTFATLIHPTVRHSQWVDFGTGSIIAAGTTLTTNIQVGAHSILNLHTTIGHDTKLGEFTSTMPGVHLSGDVVCGTGTYFGTGAVVINEVSIGSWTVVGAGAVVTGDLPSKVVAVGVPAKPIKANERVP